MYLFQIRQNPIGFGDLISGFDAGKDDPGQSGRNGSVAVSVDEVRVDPYEDLRSALAGESHALTKG